MILPISIFRFFNDDMLRKTESKIEEFKKKNKPDDLDQSEFKKAMIFF